MTGHAEAQSVPDRLLYSASEVAVLLGCSRSYVYELIGNDRLESVRLGKLIRVPRVSLEAYIERLREVSAQALAG